MLNEGATRIAGLLKEKGVEPGDRVGIMLPNVPYFGVVYYGILRAGGVVVPMNVLLKGREVAFYLQGLGREGRCSPGTTSARRRRPAPRRPAPRRSWSSPASSSSCVMDAPRRRGGRAARALDDTAVILYTSGTTGTPKGAELTHDEPARELHGDGAGRSCDVTEQDVILGALPLFHSFGQTCGLNAAVAPARA